MKARPLRILTMFLFAVALTGWVACGGDDGEGGPDATDDTTVEDSTVEPEVKDEDVPQESDLMPDIPLDEGLVDIQDDACTPDCTDRVCGDDGCGGSCGTCEFGTCIEETGQCECEPVCGDRVCGPDGCGGVCGECEGDTVCDEVNGLCVATCDFPDDLPESWGSTGVINALQTPADKTTAAAVCFDYTGEGDGDSGLVGLAGQINGPLNDLTEGGDMGILFEFAGVTDFTTTADFTLNGLIGESTQDPPVLSGEFLIDQGGYNDATCLPMIYLPGAAIVEGELVAGPATFPLSIPVMEGLVIDLTLTAAQIKGDITAADEDGVTVENGVLSGVLKKADLEKIIADLEAQCALDPVPEGLEDICPYISVAKSAMALLFDLHEKADGTFVPKSQENPGNAASLCLTFGLGPAKVVGYQMDAVQ